ncbi:MAG: FAD-dependent oxidoreductase, partial [Leptolyngbyaceae cyanobacterium SL_7_1]|nr:FAD-dependent oxidoreductase [Leptolyngbyaceae cyanobacterium SL_7_1]
LMVYAADFARLLQDAREYGWQIGESQFDWQQFRQVRDREIQRLRDSQAHALLEAGIEVIRGQACFTDVRTLTVDDRQLTAEKFLLAVGGKPIKPPIPGIEYSLTSDEIFAISQLPTHLAILGAGYIGIEFASIFRRLGTEVTVLDRAPGILTGFDPDLSNLVHEGLNQRGIQIRCNTTAEAIEPTEQGFQLQLSGETSQPITADVILCAVGRTPNLRELNLEQIGVEIKENAIAVDAHYRTSQPHIFAIGDCTDRIQLTPVAREEGRLFAAAEFGDRIRSLDYDRVPSAVFARPEAAAIGMTEPAAREKFGDRVSCQRIAFQPLYSQLLSQCPETVLLKLVVQQDSGQILGVHIVGEHAAEIIQGIALAIKQGATQQTFAQMVGIHPSSAEEFFN